MAQHIELENHRTSWAGRNPPGPSNLHRTSPRITVCAWSKDTQRTVCFWGSKHSVRPWIIQNWTMKSNKNIVLAVEHCLIFCQCTLQRWCFSSGLTLVPAQSLCSECISLVQRHRTLPCSQFCGGAHGHWSNFPASKQGICNITAQPTTRLEPEQPPHCWYNCVSSILYAFFTSKVSSPQSNCIS